VGLPVGPVTRNDNGSYHLQCECGSVLKIDDDKPSNYEKRFFIDDVSIVGCRCFASNDVKGDEAYLIANRSWHVRRLVLMNCLVIPSRQDAVKVARVGFV
jgi:hypothetical protein